MKKIFTLLFLTALFAIPRNAQAVVWEVSDGTVQRVNPVTKNPNDLVTIPAGTKFFYVFARYSNVNNVQSRYFIYGYGTGRVNYDANFPDLSLRGRIIRALGYPSYESGWSSNRNYINYVAITEDEALAVKELDLNKNSYGISGYHSLTSLEGIHVFKNLEVLDLSNNMLVDEDIDIGYLGFTTNFKNWLAEEQAKKAVDPTYYVPDMPNDLIDNDDYYYTLFLRCFPKLKKLTLRNSGSTRFESSVLDLSGNTTLKELDISGSWFKDVILSRTALTKCDLTNCGCMQVLECNDADLDVFPDLTGCTYLRILKCKNNNLTSLDLTPCPRLRELYCSDNGLESITFNSKVNMNVVECQRNNLKSLTIPGTFMEAGLEEDLSGGDGTTLPDIIISRESYIDCSENSTLQSLSFNPGQPNLIKLSCWNCDLTSLDLSGCTKLKELRMSNNRVSSLDLSNNYKLELLTANNNRLTTLDCSNLTALKEAQLSRNKMTSLNMSGCTSIQTLLCDNQGGTQRLLETLNLKNCSNLTTLDCQNNALLSLDLSTCNSLQASGIKGYTQRAVKDVVVLDRNKVCIELVNGITPTIADNGTISDANMTGYFGTWAGSGFDKDRNKVIKRNGKTYLVIHDISNDARGGSQTKADVDFYGKQLKYQYALEATNWDETLGGSLANSRKGENITVTTYPYVMYINPTSADIHSVGEGNAPFYSGTIYLDYDAIVPEGTTVYIAKKIKIRKEEIYSTPSGGHEKVVADQLQLVPLVPGEGATEVVIPAYTPVYVKSATETGLFSFDRNNHGGVAQPLGVAEDGSHLITDNIFKGALTDSAVTKYSVLALGRGRPAGSGDEGYTTQSRIGFWPSSRTVIPAHRVFIPIGELENAGVNSNSPGLLFSFTNDIDENTTTDIRTAVINKNEGWYTINGVRLNGRPTEKGIYIHNGRKEVIR